MLGARLFARAAAVVLDHRFDQPSEGEEAHAAVASELRML